LTIGQAYSYETSPIFSLERALHKGYYLKGSVKKYLVVSLEGLDAKKN
jgi:hypothetical protein